jgi:hypothetical protein
VGARGEGYTHDFVDDPLVGVEVEGEAGVAARVQDYSLDDNKSNSLFFDEDAGSPLDGFCANATLSPSEHAVSDGEPALLPTMMKRFDDGADDGGDGEQRASLCRAVADAELYSS